MLYIILFFSGCLTGVLFMCLFQINKGASQAEYRFTAADKQRQKGGFDEQSK